MAGEAARGATERSAESAPVTFVGVVVSLARTAAVHFGDRPDPGTGSPGAPDLAAAQRIIDMLAMLEEKTRGNLTPEERQLMEGILQDLRLRHVQVAAGQSAPSQGPPQP